MSILGNRWQYHLIRTPPSVPSPDVYVSRFRTTQPRRAENVPKRSEAAKLYLEDPVSRPHYMHYASGMLDDRMICSLGLLDGDPFTFGP